ncbi:MAG TPA: NAD-glutamate dehydrogenase domain-containing protein, partial [Myxococcaceae bacterium]
MAIDGVASLDEDRILRSFLSVIRAVVRTNYFRTGTDGRPLPYVSVKLDPSGLALLPRPRPRFEVFVYSPRFEGVHLRGGKVARGGIRWSDRPEDFRSEILGLLKAQMVKNALIVPVGAKGGFVVKGRPKDSDRERREEAIACYRMFLSGLLDLTDNIVDGEVRPPERVVRSDDDDTYLVVAADKGTASFSDIANQVSDSYGYWLGDAFASGGSRGYDHKKMGITARGSWESVKRHFRELGTDIQTADFTVVGIGDMSGDVFGNGMLLSPHIKLVAAFNHRHVFLDPDPDPEASYNERKRLFDLPR